MKKALSLVISIIIAVQAVGCSRAPRLDLSTFEKYVLSDLELEKKESLEESPLGYYLLDSTIDNTSDPSTKLDHYAQVYSKATNGTVGELYMIYSDYQDETVARNFYNEVSAAEKQLVEEAPDTHKSSSGNDYLLVMTTKDYMTYSFECLYIQKDIILFASIILSASEIERMDADWLKKIDKTFKHLRLHSPFSLAPEIEDLL